MNRGLKRLVIGVIFTLIVGGVVYGVNYLNSERPTCSDGVKNGKEEGVDCGALACGVECPPQFLPLEVSNIDVLEVLQGDYDFVAEVYNPNQDYGTAEAVYDLVLYGANDREIYRNEKSFYILPNQTKYIVESSIAVSGEALRAEMEIKSIQWEKLDLIGAVDFYIQNQDRSVLDGKSELYGIAFNNSDFDLDRVDITVVFTNSGGDIVAVGMTHVRTLLAHTQRQFVVAWPFVLNFQNLNTTIEFGTNLFLNSNYIKQYGSPKEKFQQYY
jgi:hypothetical protein